MSRFDAVMDDADVLPKQIGYQVVEEGWTNPRTRLKGQKTIQEVLIFDVENNFAKDQPANGDITVEKLSLIQRAFNETFVLGYPAGEVSGSHGPTK